MLRTIPSILVGSMLICGPIVLHAETVALKDGRTLQGKVIIKGQTVTILVGPRIYQFKKDQIAVLGGKTPEKGKQAAKSAGGKTTGGAPDGETRQKTKPQPPEQPRK